MSERDYYAHCRLYFTTHAYNYPDASVEIAARFRGPHFWRAEAAASSFSRVCFPRPRQHTLSLRQPYKAEAETRLKVLFIAERVSVYSRTYVGVVTLKNVISHA